MNVGTTTTSNVLRRQRVSLDGDWNVIVDPYEMRYVGIDPRGLPGARPGAPRHPGRARWSAVSK